MANDDTSLAAYASSCERDGGVILFGPKFSAVPNDSGRMPVLSPAGAASLQHIGIAGAPGLLSYVALTSAEECLGAMPVAIVPVWDGSDGETVGLLIVRREAHFEEQDLQRLVCLVPAAFGVTRTLPPTVSCFRCEQIVPTSRGADHRDWAEAQLRRIPRRPPGKRSRRADRTQVRGTEPNSELMRSHDVQRTRRGRESTSSSALFRFTHGEVRGAPRTSHGALATSAVSARRAPSTSETRLANTPGTAGVPSGPPHRIPRQLAMR